MKTKLSDFFVYRLRYILGYIALASLYIAAVVVSALYAPGGLTQAEIDMVAITNTVRLTDLDTIAIPNAPLHVLQLLSFKLFGVSILSIKLPAIALSVVSAIAIFFLLRHWFKSSISILSLLIMVATAQFIFIGQSFTPHILYITYSALILLFATLIMQQRRPEQLWRTGLAVTVPLSLLTPYFWYINLGLLLAALAHPHTRHFLLARRYRARWVPAVALLAACLLIVGVLCLAKPALVSTVLGVSALEYNLIANLKTLFYSYLSFETVIIHGQMMPIMDFSALFLAMFGLLKTIQQRQTARSYMIWAWLLLSLPLLLVQPLLTVIVTVPLFILLAVGLESLLHEWYKLFPRNPYARGTGLFLIIVLISIMVISGLNRYVYGYRYMPESAREFNTDISLITAETSKVSTVSLLVTPAEYPVYAAMARYNGGNLRVTTDPPSEIRHTIYLSYTARQRVDDRTWQLSSIVVNDRSNQADRFYVYRPPQQPTTTPGP